MVLLTLAVVVVNGDGERVFYLLFLVIGFVVNRALATASSRDRMRNEAGDDLIQSNSRSHRADSPHREAELGSLVRLSATRSKSRPSAFVQSM